MVSSLVQPDGISNHDVLILTFIVVVVSYIASAYWEQRLSKALFFPNEIAIKKEILELEKQAAVLNTTDTWNESARVERKLIILRKKLSEEVSQRHPNLLGLMSLFSLIGKPSQRRTLAEADSANDKPSKVRGRWLGKALFGWISPPTRRHLHNMLPGIITYVIRYGPVGGLGLLWWGRPQVGQLPRCLAMSAFMQVVCLPAVMLDFLKQGPRFMSSGQYHSSIKMVPTANATIDSIYEKPVSFGIFIWILMCFCTLKFTLRVFG
ncbi:unnamed protein product [Phytomonas sp. Hart1]|nr:unnamed protein product [Phytomonas sp. Hart1]|eukprot:CCW66189.1 unnamed protein product [Phytomonas sp. isolate Hart1]